MIGKLIGVGVGPGDPDLLTMKAVHLIQSAQVLAYTADSQGRSYARQTAAEYIRAGQKELPLHFSMSPDRDERVRSRQEAARQVLSLLTEGSDVVFITEGDPLLYSTFQHLKASLPRDIRVEVCPGISAMNAAAAAAGFSLAVEGEMLNVAPADVGLKHIHDWLTQKSSVVLFKTARRYKQIRDELQTLDQAYTAVLVEHVSTSGEKVIRQCEDWPGDDAPYFSIILIRPQTSSERMEES